MTRPGGRELAGYGVWGFTGAVIAVPELWAAVDSDHVPWPTISGTVGYLEYWHTWVAVIIIGALVWAVFHAVKYSGGVGGGSALPADASRRARRAKIRSERRSRSPTTPWRSVA